MGGGCWKGLHYSREIQFELGRHIFTHPSFQAYLPKGTVLKQRAVGTRTDTASFSSAGFWNVQKPTASHDYLCSKDPTRLENSNNNKNFFSLFQMTTYKDLSFLSPEPAHGRHANRQMEQGFKAETDYSLLTKYPCLLFPFDIEGPSPSPALSSMHGNFFFFIILEVCLCRLYMLWVGMDRKPGRFLCRRVT